MCSRAHHLGRGPRAPDCCCYKHWGDGGLVCVSFGTRKSLCGSAGRGARSQHRHLDSSSSWSGFSPSAEPSACHQVNGASWAPLPAGTTLLISRRHGRTGAPGKPGSTGTKRGLPSWYSALACHHFAVSLPERLEWEETWSNVEMRTTVSQTHTAHTSVLVKTTCFHYRLS